ncbi:MAG: hypothetical protein NVSMB31_08600 [Vulcanimicrobiaceae bacterium]
MPQLVDALFEGALKEEVLVGVFPVKLRPEAMERHHGQPLLLVRVAKKKAMSGLVEIEFGDRKEQAVLAGVSANDFGSQGAQEHLSALAIDRAARNGKGALGIDSVEEPFF